MWYHSVNSAPPAGIIHLVSTARTKIITIAQIETMAMPMAMWSLSALTAPPTAMEADTPQTAPPEPRTAPKRGSSANTRVAAR
jgi:hypothetical protein